MEAHSCIATNSEISLEQYITVDKYVLIARCFHPKSLSTTHFAQSGTIVEPLNRIIHLWHTTTFLDGQCLLQHMWAPKLCQQWSNGQCCYQNSVLGSAHESFGMSEVPSHWGPSNTHTHRDTNSWLTEVVVALSKPNHQGRIQLQHTTTTSCWSVNAPHSVTALLGIASTRQHWQVMSPHLTQH